MDSQPDVLGFPLWLRINHFINLFCIFLLMWSGIQILADYPKLYWNDDSVDESEWMKFGKKRMPKDRLWTSMDEAEHVNSIIALPRNRSPLASVNGGRLGCERAQLCHITGGDGRMETSHPHRLVHLPDSAG
jgi:hypothetical protein